MVAYRWKIFWADLNPVIGSEQAGKRPIKDTQSSFASPGIFS